MQTVDQIARAIVKREGGYVNDPSDLGGATKYGVTIGTMRRLGLDLDKDGDVDASDVRRLTQKRAVEIFKQHYYYHPKIDKLPQMLAASVFDMQVNAGNNAIKLLQRLLQKFGEPVVEDGALGPQTIGAAQRVYEAAGSLLVDAYGIERRNYYYRLADKRVASRKYARTKQGAKGGWIKRAEEFISERYHLTPAAHTQRIAQWG